MFMRPSSLALGRPHLTIPLPEERGAIRRRQQGYRRWDGSLKEAVKTAFGLLDNLERGFNVGTPSMGMLDGDRSYVFPFLLERVQD